VDDYLLNTLDQEERVRLKLLNPLNVGLTLARKYKETAFDRLKMLAEDVSTLQNIDTQLAAFHQEMLRDFEPRLGRMDALLSEMEVRGLNFFDERIRFGRIRELMNSDAIRRDFERDVVGDTPRDIDDEVGRVIDWIVERNLKLWQDISGYIDRRQIARHREGMIGEVTGNFSYNRQALLDSIGRASREAVGTYNREAEGRKLADEVRSSSGTTMFAGAGMGLGVLMTALLSGAVADVTGVVLATTLAATGLYVIPRAAARPSRSSRKRFRPAQPPARRPHAPGHGAISDSTERVNESIAPYRRFVQVQQDQLNEPATSSSPRRRPAASARGDRRKAVAAPKEYTVVSRPRQLSWPRHFFMGPLKTRGVYGRGCGGAPVAGCARPRTADAGFARGGARVRRVDGGTRGGEAGPGGLHVSAERGVWMVRGRGESRGGGAKRPSHPALGTGVSPGVAPAGRGAAIGGCGGPADLSESGGCGPGVRLQVRPRHGRRRDRLRGVPALPR
jgi:hypothetical protein